MSVDEQQLPVLITALLQKEVYAHEVTVIQLIQTHISWVILTGSFAYKIKKPVNFGFLDFSTLEKRHHYCNEELRLNRRLASSIYLEVIAITGTETKPVLNGQAPVVEYAIKMAQFPQAMQLDHMLERGALNTGHMEAIARMVADFHQHTDIAGSDSAYGMPETVYLPVEENFRQIRERISDRHYLEQLAVLENSGQQTFKSLKPALEQRKQAGFIRECHGDMHLRNLVWHEHAPVAFDCIEFNPEFRWIDVISEVAFLQMDLQDRQQHQLAQCFLNAYLENTGDYAGVALLPFYCCYRAMVRAKVAAIRLSQQGLDEEEKKEITREFATYLGLAESYGKKATPMLIITVGMSASGKSTLSQQVLERLPAIRIRSDVERKRLYAVDTGRNTRDDYGQGIYSPQATQQTYNKLVELASDVLDAGFSVIIDAANLKREQRERFCKLAAEKSLPYMILQLIASPDTLRQRIVARKQDVSDADLSILEQQLNNWQPVSEKEQRFVVEVETEKELNINDLLARIAQQSRMIPELSDLSR